MEGELGRVEEEDQGGEWRGRGGSKGRRQEAPLRTPSRRWYVFLGKTHTHTHTHTHTAEGQRCDRREASKGEER